MDGPVAPAADAALTRRSCFSFTPPLSPFDPQPAKHPKISWTPKSFIQLYQSFRMFRMTVGNVPAPQLPTEPDRIPPGCFCIFRWGGQEEPAENTQPRQVLRHV